jgi:NADPH2:quinone reductase
VTGVEPGTRVVAQTGAGGFAEFVAAPARSVVALPDGIGAATAATVMQSYSTALFALTVRDHVQEGETVVVLGAGGGVGLASVDVATSLGARVIAVASTGEKRGAAMAAGAVAAIDPAAEDLKLRVRELTDGGADVVVDPVGGALAEPALRALRFGGRFLVVGFAGGAIPRVPLNLVLLNSRTIVGIEWGGWLVHHPGAAADVSREILEGITAGRLHPVAPVVRPLTEAAAVLADLAGRRVTGKVALTP